MSPHFKNLTLLAMMCVSQSLLKAEVLTHSTSFDIAPPFSSPATQLFLGKFDSQGGTRILDSVQLTLNGTLAAGILIENDDPQGAFVAPSIRASLEVTPWNGNSKALINYIGTFQSYEGSDGIAGSGADFRDLGVITQGFNFSDLLTTGLNSYIGSDMLTFDLGVTSSFLAVGGAQAAIDPYDFQMMGDLSVTYNYHTVPVPEPSSMVFLVLTGIGFALRRRRDEKVMFPLFE